MRGSAQAVGSIAAGGRPSEQRAAPQRAPAELGVLSGGPGEKPAGDAGEQERPVCVMSTRTVPAGNECDRPGDRCQGGGDEPGEDIRPDSIARKISTEDGGCEHQQGGKRNQVGRDERECRQAEAGGATRS